MKAALFMDVEREQDRPNQIKFSYYVEGNPLSELRLPTDVHGFVSPLAAKSLIVYLTQIVNYWPAAPAEPKNGAKDA